MIQRIVTCNVRPDKLNELRKILIDSFIPKVKQQPGFVDLIESVNVDDGTYVCSTFWKTRDDVNGYDASLFQEIASTVMPLLNGAPTVNTLEVETSTPHRISTGRSAAA